MVMGFDPSDLIDSSSFCEDAQSHFDVAGAVIVGLLPMSVGNAVQRYEKKLGRKLTVNEGQVLIHALTQKDPQNIVGRFSICGECGRWIDNGPLEWRGEVWKGICDYCDIPF